MLLVGAYDAIKEHGLKRKLFVVLPNNAEPTDPQSRSLAKLSALCDSLTRGLKGSRT